MPCMSRHSTNSRPIAVRGCTSPLRRAAAWRQARKADGSGWTALRLFLQDALVPPVLPASDEELAALAFGRDTAVAS